jgi:hypothetical protein
VFHFIQWLDFDIPLPANFVSPKLFLRKDRMRSGLVQWEFEILAREIVLNGGKFGDRAFNSWDEVAHQINTIKFLENEAWNDKHSDDILYELVRIAHRQFPWQRGISRPHISRYARLYQHAGLSEMIAAEYGMSYMDILQISLGLIGHFVKNNAVRLPLRNELNNASAEASAAFVRRFSCTIEELRDEYEKLASYDLNWAYTFNPLRSKPLIRLNDEVAICPIPTFLIRRATNEIYFDLVRDQPGFAKNFGPAVQELVGEIAARSNRSGRSSVIGEAPYGSKTHPKDTVDWIVQDTTASLFIECKGARVRYAGISDLTDRRFIEGEFDRIRDFTVQLYKTLNDALNGQYPNWKPDGRPVYPLIVTLEDWQTFGIHVDRLVIDPLKSKLQQLGIDPVIVDEHPPSFCAMDTFEIAAGVWDSVSIETLFGAKTKGEHAQWALDTFLVNNFRAEVDSLRGSVFSDQWDILLRRPN